MHATQNVTVSNTRIEGWGLINIYAGQSGDGNQYSNISANATTTVYNQALIPISAAYEGRADTYVNSTLTLGTGSLVIGVNNVFLGADTGRCCVKRQGHQLQPVSFVVQHRKPR